MTSPAERFAAASRAQAYAETRVGNFQAGLEFSLDPFQITACEALDAGRGVLVAAPTGAGKTVVGEFAVYCALAEGTKCFYTTPIKALSNQKYAEFAHRYGPAEVGLLTGDTAINGEAPVVVMTTEVLRNMLYSGSSSLAGLGYVVMDEVHYLADRFRGAVWEEVIIHLPPAVRLASLSATVSNAEEFGQWLAEVRGDTTVVVEEHRPVPLWQHVMADRRIYDLFVDDGGPKPTLNPELEQLARQRDRSDTGPHSSGRRHSGHRGRRYMSERTGPRTPSRTAVVDRLNSDGLLPAITFVFSRAGCEAAVAQCLRTGLRLTTPAEQTAIAATANRRCGAIPEQDLAIVGYYEWLDGLLRGIAAHHAGMLPTFKEVVEELFSRGLVKAVFATETLALGINMPARTVVLERLVKWNGETHAEVTPGEYTQLTGRAGRRGIDVEGHAVVLWQPDLEPRSVAGLASTRTYPLRSSFRPTYNMAVNLVDRVGRSEAGTLLEASFAQFQADRAVVGLNRQLTRHTETLAEYQRHMACDCGDFDEYARLRRSLSDRERELVSSGVARQRTAAAASLAALRRGDVIHVPAGRRAGMAVVLDPGISASGDDPRPTVLMVDRRVHRLTIVDFPTQITAVGRLRIPGSFHARSPQARRDLASSLRGKLDALPVPSPPPGSRQRSARRGGAAGDDPEIVRLRAELRHHPCHRCPDREDHSRWAERWWRLSREVDGLRRQIAGRSHVISRTFTNICAVLDELGYLSGDQVPASGQRLAGIYTELDLVVAQCLRSGLWKDLNPDELASCVSTLVFESRESGAERPVPRLPSTRVSNVCADMTRIWAELRDIEQRHGLTSPRAPDLGFALAAYRWAAGLSLDDVLPDTDMAAGDFVRWTKQLIDLLGQLASLNNPDTLADSHGIGNVARQAVTALRRGVVLSGTEPVPEKSNG
jgi:ATP-dependent RNA helicase HelY